MKLLLIGIFFLPGGAIAFSPASSTSLQQKRRSLEIGSMAKDDNNNDIIITSQSLPFMPRPEVLDGTMVGDMGFDPLGLAKNKEDLALYREAELKHARLAMLAVVGWPLSELFDRPLANYFGWKPLLDESDTAPSILNGGLDKISPVYWTVVLLLSAWIDYNAVRTMYENEKGYFPGNLQFDPLGLYPKEDVERRRMQLAELKNGRLAM
jgi:hypothetical protein